jgi:thiol-disulfide isomerase/thioredoxin
MEKKLFLIVALMSASSVLQAGVTAISSPRQFNDIIKRSPLVVAEFYSEGCPHCKRFNTSGIFERLANQLKDVAFVQINSAHNSLFTQHLVNGVPTFIFFKNGASVGKNIVGAPTQKTIEDRIAAMR